MATREVVVLGAGPAGFAAAISAARAGAGTTLIANEPIGGRATHASFVPSKVLLHRAASAPQRFDEVRPAIADAIARRSKQQAERLEDAGVSVVRGLARFVTEHVIEIIREGRDPERMSFDAAVIAVGSIPRFPTGFFGDVMKAPDGKRILAPRHFKDLEQLPKTILVIGGGATGAEAVHAFTRFGVEVTWILDEYGILPRFDRELADSLGDVLMERGVKIVHGKAVVQVITDSNGVLAKLDGGRTYEAEQAFVAIGRRADTEHLGLDAIGLERVGAEHSIAVDRRMQTGLAHVFAAGDVTGAPMLESKAALQGTIAGGGAAGLKRPLEVCEDGWLEAVYTEPEVARIGMSAQKAMSSGHSIDVRTIGFDESLKGLLAKVGVDPHARGTLRVVLDLDSQQILGASAIGPHAAEVLGPIAVAMRVNATVDQLASAGLASPTFGELATLALR